MSRIRSDLAALLILAALACAAAGGGQTDSADRPGAGAALTNVDIVRMTAARLPSEAIVKAIQEAATTAFDLDPEVVVELRRAGVADAVIEAMRRAQPAASAAPSPPGPPEGALVLSFEGDRAKPYGWTAVAPARSREDSQVSLAFFALCMDPTHVPDQWQALTPLASFPRHHLLWFQEATVPYKGSARGGLVYLDLPASHRLSIETGRHPLLVGVAGRAGDQDWLGLSDAHALAEARAGQDTRVRIAIKTRKAALSAAGVSPYECRILEVDPPPSTPEPSEP